MRQKLRKHAVASGIGSCLVTRAALAAITLAACVPQTSSAPVDPEFKLRALRAAVVEYRTRVGDLPATLEQICIFDPTLCRMETAERWFRDAWGTTVRYEGSAGSFRITSAGPDRGFDTEDDLLLDALRDSVLTSRMAGCYELDERVARLDGTRIELTTRSIRSGGYAIRSPLRVLGDTASLAEWYPVSDDSLAARWIRIDQGVSIRARISEGRLLGRAAGRVVRGQKIACDE